jgi:hypothetical protein
MFTRIMCAATLALTLSACGGINTKDAMPTLLSTESSVQLASLPGKCQNPPSDKMLLSMTGPRSGLPAEFRRNKVVDALLTSAEQQTAVAARVVLLTRHPQLAVQATTSTATSDSGLTEARHILDAANHKIASYSAPNLSQEDFKEFGKLAADLAFNPTIRPANRLAALSTPAEAESNLLIEYFSAYFEGEFVDRFGTMLPKPTLSRSINNQFIAGAIAVLMEYILDAALDTPVWTDAAGKFYPGAFDKQPTVLKLNRAKTASLLTDDQTQQCGITKLKSQAINYLSQQAGNRAALLSGMVGESFGGFEVGLGFLGKFSLGDNQTLQTVVKTTLSVAAMRLAEHGSYEILREIGHDKNDKLIKLLEYVLNKKS